MRRPKDSADKKCEDEPPPGGRARKRLEQFNRARGLTEDTPEQAPEKTPDASRIKDTPAGKKNRA